jgi:hypothetical protein
MTDEFVCIPDITHFINSSCKQTHLDPNLPQLFDGNELGKKNIFIQKKININLFLYIFISSDLTLKNFFTRLYSSLHLEQQASFSN